MPKWLTHVARDILAAALPVIVGRLLAVIAEPPRDDDRQGVLPLDVPPADVKPSGLSSSKPASPVPPASVPRK